MFLFKVIIPNLVVPHSAFCYKGIMKCETQSHRKVVLLISSTFRYKYIYIYICVKSTFRKDASQKLTFRQKSFRWLNINCQTSKKVSTTSKARI